jgi:hypothetical protein
MKLDTLLQRYLQGDISREEMQQLNTLLRSDRAARRQFREMLNLDSALAEAAADTARNAANSARIYGFPSSRFGLAAAAVLLACFLWFQLVPTFRQPFATVVAVAGAAPDAASKEWAPGSPVGGQLSDLCSGTLELLTQSGAKVVIEAPAQFQFQSRNRMNLTRGRVAADVPPSAKGFTVITPGGEAIDLGTRFGVDVQNNGASEIHVFQGEVIAKASRSPGKSLRTGDALAFLDSQTQTRNLRGSVFIQPGEVSALSAGLAAGQKQRADSQRTLLLNDPALIALLDFEESEPAFSGNYRITQGRWPGSKAAEFSELGHHLKVELGEERDWPQLTLAAWVRIDQLGAPFQSLLHTNGWDKDRPGQVHWMVTQQMTMRLALRANTPSPGSEQKSGYPDSLTSVLPDRGRWMHLATVYDAHTRSTRFYLNGKRDGEFFHGVAHPAKLGAAQIGNWDRMDRKLSGRIDELLLLGRALSDTEISALHEAGTPYR